MTEQDVTDLVRRRFADRHGADVAPSFDRWLGMPARHGGVAAVLGVRPAASSRLFLECYMDAPVEVVVSAAFGRTVGREAIVEIGCHAAAPTASLLMLWRDTATALHAEHEIAVATLTAPLRRSLRRLGIGIIELAPAEPSRAPGAGAKWGRYYDHDPRVCAGLIADGAAALRGLTVPGRLAA